MTVPRSTRLHRASIWGYRMIALEVDDMQKTADYLRTKDVDIVWSPRVRETYSRAEIRDPNGYRIELRQWYR
jgi:catechol 2,3-dioxygenase-like lactoylglutathione lyase family enzyme